MSESAKMAFLRSHNAAYVVHGAATLLDHLEGVRDLLLSWGAEESLADAGLFHSVYGTESFGKALIPGTLRGEVRETIGAEAERLAFLFGVMEKASFDESVFRGEDFRIVNRHTSESSHLGEPEWRDLCELVVANWLEQHPRVPPEYKQHKAAMFKVVRQWLTDGARRALDGAYGFAS